MQNINEELNRMLYLTQHKRGLVISEQNRRELGDTNIPDAKGNSKGTTTLMSTESPSFLTKNVSFNGEIYNLSFYRELGKNLGKVTPGTPEIKIPSGETPTMPELILLGSELPYPDNFINPQFDLYPGTESKVDEYVKIISDLIKNTGGLDSNNEIKLLESNKDKDGKSIFIKGNADYFKPTTQVPNEMRKKGITKIDHDYGGETDPSKMNLYLANQRAIKFGDVLSQKLSKKTGIPASVFLGYMSFLGYSYYGSGNKGVKSIEVKINGSSESNPSIIPGKIIPGTNGKYEPPTEEVVEVDLTPYGGSLVKGTTLFDNNGNQFIGLPIEIVKELSKNKILIQYEPNIQFNGQSNPEFKIKNDKISLGGVNFGKLVPSETIITDPFGEYASNPGIYVISNYMSKDRKYVGIHKLYLVLTPPKLRANR